MEKGDIIQIFLVILSIFIPLMFSFSKNLVEQVAKSPDSDEKTKISAFISYSGYFLQALAMFLIFQILKIILGKYIEWINFVYLIGLGIYIKSEYFEEHEEHCEKIIISISTLFGLIPVVLSTIMLKCYDQSASVNHDRTASAILTLCYMLIWLSLPVKYHPLENLRTILENNAKQKN